MHSAIITLALIAISAAANLSPGRSSASPIPSNPTRGSSVQNLGPQKTLIPPTSHFKHFDCGTNIDRASDHFLSTVHGLHNQSLDTKLAQAPGSKARQMVKRATSNFVVPLYIHVVTTKANAGTIPQQMIQNQVNAMNNAYKPYGISFNFLGSDTTVNDTWAIGGTSKDDLTMKAALRKGNYSTLNLYMQSDLAGGILGRCTLPTDIGSSASPATYVIDGCNIAAGTMPGGPIGGYNLGLTAVHETGHWLGLLHTFEGYSCTGNGDFVADTPSESQSTDGCPTNPWKNSCPSRTGVDPIHNYMDYSIDACYTRFTPGQEARMKTLWPTYRQGR